MNAKWKNIGILFLTFLKIGAFTFGGGYAMIALLENELITRKRWLTQPESPGSAAPQRPPLAFASRRSRLFTRFRVYLTRFCRFDGWPVHSAGSRPALCI